MAGNTSRGLRGSNRFEVLHRVYASGSATRQAIAASAGLSFATVATVVNELLDQGVLYEVSLEDSAGGRPRARLAVNPERGSILGVDVAETYVRIDLYDLALEPRARHTEPLHPGENHPADVVRHIQHGIEGVLTETGTAHAEVLGTGVSLPGQVDRDGGVSVFAPNFSWKDVPFVDLLAERIDLPLHLDNPLKASTVAELWFGAGRDARDLVVLTLGTGVGAGFAIGGALVRGVTNGAGEWGHTALVLDGRPCRCGKAGCLEAYVGARGIIEQIRGVAPGSDLLLQAEDQEATIDALAAALARDDRQARTVLDQIARYLGAGIANLVNVLDPEVIVLGGWVADRLGAWLLPAARAAAAPHTFDRTFAARLELSGLDRNPVSLGAAIFALEHFLATLGVAARR